MIRKYIERKHKNWKEEAEEINKKISNDNVLPKEEIKEDETKEDENDITFKDVAEADEAKEENIKIPQNPFKGFVKQKISTSRSLMNNHKGP